MKKTLLALLLLTAISSSYAQQQIKRVLFIGNSYTYVNDLPGLFANVAQTAGDSVIYDSNCIGGYTFQLHSTNATTLQKIAQGNFDYVVLQEQSQLPSFPISQVQSSVFPYAKALDSLITLANPCTETVFYMTWGRKNGDASNCANWPPLCTYSGMDSLLRLRYEYMANTNNALVSPVGAVWRHIRNNYPNIELYNADESHPSLAGSYAAACTFYSIIFRKDPTTITFASTLDSTDAAAIRNATKLVAYDSLNYWNVGDYDLNVQFNFSMGSPTAVILMNQSTNCDSVLWNFGDGQQSTIGSPIHVYQSSGNYTITLIGYHCNETDTFSLPVTIGQVGLEESENNANYNLNITADGHLIINGETKDIRALSIYNSVGQLVYQSMDLNNKIPLDNITNGVYILKVKTENAIHSLKFIRK